MRAKTLEQLQYFVGKVCSIVTSSMNRNFDEAISREHFVVRVREVNIDGLWGTHWKNDDMVSFFSASHIISVHQEMEIDLKNPEHVEMIKEYEKKTGKKLKPDLGKIPDKAVSLPVVEKPPVQEDGDALFVDIASLEKLVENAKRSSDIEEKFKL